MSAKRFRIAFSFAGEKREFVSKVVAILETLFGQERILYDKYHEAEFARRNLGFYLPELYHKQSDLVVVVVCPEYDEKEWTGLEWTAIHDLLKTRKDDEVMLCRFGRAQVAGLYSTSGFVELDNKTPDETATLILQRLALNEGKAKNHYAAGPRVDEASVRSASEIGPPEGAPGASEPNLMPETAKVGSDPRRGSRRMSTPLWVAIISGVFALLAAITIGLFGLAGNYFKVLPNGPVPDKTIEYKGQVIDAETKLPLSRAKVILEPQGASQDHYTDPKGNFSLQFPRSTTAASLRIEEADHENIDQNITPSRTGIEIILLPPLIEYMFKVISGKRPIPGAVVSVKINGAERSFTTDSGGIFHLKLPRSITAVHVKIAVSDYKVFDRPVTLTTEPNYVRLEREQQGRPGKPIDWEKKIEEAMKPKTTP